MSQIYQIIITNLK